MNQTTEPTFTEATPRRGTVRDSWGDPCAKATSESYPLRARCEHCSAEIRCTDGQAAWAHRRSQQVRCGR